MTEQELRNWIEWIEEQKVVTGEEKLYFDRMKSMKSGFFRPKNIRSKLRIVLDEINIKLPINSN